MTETRWHRAGSPRPVVLLARLCPATVAPSEELERAVDFLGWRTPAELLVRAGYGVGVVGLGLTVVFWVLAPPGWKLPCVAAILGVSVLGVHAVHAGPLLLATARRTSALGDAPDLVARAVLRMRLTPAPERAALYSAREGDGPLAASLERHVDRARGEPRTGLKTFGAEWEPWFPALRRSLNLLEAGGSAPPGDREKTLERALDIVLDGTRSTMATFAGEIQGPATGLYAFGVLLPTALVALVPAAGMTGLTVTPLAVGLVYNALLPAVLLLGSAWILARRPVAFRPPTVTTRHPHVPARGRLAAVFGVGVAVFAWVATARILPVWGPPITAVGFGLGSALWITYEPVTTVYERIHSIEAGLSDALTLVGRRVANGTSVEAAIAAAATELDGEMGSVLETAARQQRQLTVGVEESFLGEYGALADVPSPRLRSTAGLLARAGQDGAPAGRSLLALGTHLEDLEAVEEEARRSLDSVYRTLGSTASLFGPLVAGATVAMADGLARGGAMVPGGSTDPMPWLGLSVGVYVLLLAVILTTLSTGLKRGLDRPLVGHRIGRSLVVATASYVGAYALAAGIA